MRITILEKGTACRCTQATAEKVNTNRCFDLASTPTRWIFTKPIAYAEPGFLKTPKWKTSEYLFETFCLVSKQRFPHQF